MSAPKVMAEFPRVSPAGYSQMESACFMTCIHEPSLLLLNNKRTDNAGKHTEQIILWQDMYSLCNFIFTIIVQFHFVLVVLRINCRT